MTTQSKIINIATAPDALIFDMDGTLWDAAESYAAIWNACSDEFGLERRISGELLHKYMGKQLEDIFFGLFGYDTTFNHKEYIARLSDLEEIMMPSLGGVMYPGVKEGLEKLSAKYTLMAQSNCGVGGLKNFMKFTGTEPYFTDSLTFGQSRLPKSQNIRLLMQRNNIASAIYVGDTQGDCDNAHAAGIPFAHAAYGFGACTDANLSFDNFDELVRYFLALK